MFAQVINDLMILFVFLLIGFVIRNFVKPLQKLFIPAGIIAGILALVLGPQVLGLIELPETWASMATPMINIVLTCTIFGTVINKSKIKTYAGAINVIVTTYFAQLALGIPIGYLLSKIWPNLPYSWGIMTVFCYWGGHGAATSAGTLFEEMGVENMLSMGIILATLGLILAMLLGMILVNYGVRKGYSKYSAISKTNDDVEADKKLQKDKRQVLGFATVPSSAINGLAFQGSLIMLSMWTGTMIFGTLKKLIPATSSIPSLLYGIVGAAIIWTIMQKLKIDDYADKKTVDSISGVALEICIFSATATLNLEVFASYLLPITIYTIAIMVLMVFLCMVMIRRWIKADWFELALMAFGQGTGSTPSGLALARCVDPETKAGAWEAFGIALGVFTPISSTLVAILPVIAMKSQWAVMFIGLAVCLVTFIIGERVLRRQ